MITVLHAEAGLSECVRYDVCDPGLGIWLVQWIAGIVLVIVWLTMSLVATVDVLDAPIGVRRTVRWLAVVWLVPVLGAILWFRSAVEHPPPTGPVRN